MLTISRFASRVAQNAINFALVLLIVEETGRTVYSSLLVLALVLPSTLFGIFAGVAADHLPRRPLILFGNGMRAAICLYAGFHLGGVASYYVVAFTLAAASPFASSAEGAIQPLVVERARLAKANAISHAVGGGAQLVGFGLLTPLVLRVFHEPRILFFICAGLYLVAAVYGVAIGRIRRPERQEVGGSSEGSWWSAGWRQMQSDPAVMHAAVELTLISTAVIILGGLIPKYIHDVLGLPVDIGVLILMPGAFGVALGLRVAGFLSHRLPHSLLSTGGFLAFVVLLALLASANPLSDFLGGFGFLSWLNSVKIGSFDGGGVVAMAVVAPLGFAYALVAVAGQTVLQDRVPIQLLGRVGATQGAMAALAASVPVVVFGVLGDWIGVPIVMAILAAVIGTLAFANGRAKAA